MADALYLPVFSALLAAAVTQGYVVTSNAGGTGAVTATTAALAASITGTYEGIAIQGRDTGKVIEVQRIGRVDAAYVPWLGAGISEPCVVDANGKPQRASAAAGTTIGTVDKQGNVWLFLPLGVLAYQTLYYQTIQANGSDQTQRTKLNFSADFGVADVGGVTKVSLAAAVASGAALAGLRWELPLAGGVCPFAMVVGTRMDGDPSTVYSVQLQFRGVCETNTYTGGSSSTYFQTGGACSQTISANRNIYRLIVEDPAQTYFLNKSQGAGDQGAVTVALDYTVTISIRGESRVTLVAESFDKLEAANTTGTILPGDGAAYVGQAIQMDVVSVT